MYFPKIDLINGVYFTQREIEVISCILNVRGVKNRVERALTSTPSHATVRAMSHTAASVLCLPKAL